MIIVACPYLQTVRASTTYHIPGESTSSPEHAGALGHRCVRDVTGLPSGGVSLDRSSPRQRTDIDADQVKQSQLMTT